MSYSYAYFAGLVVKLQDDGMSPDDFMSLGANLIEHAHRGCSDRDHADENAAHVLKQLRTNLGMDLQ